MHFADPVVVNPFAIGRLSRARSSDQRRSLQKRVFQAQKERLENDADFPRS